MFRVIVGLLSGVFVYNLSLNMLLFCLYGHAVGVAAAFAQDSLC